MPTNLRNALMSGKRTPTAKDYVQSGLVAMWDGIENAGWGQHSDITENSFYDNVNGYKIALNGYYLYGAEGLFYNPTQVPNNDICATISSGLYSAVNTSGEYTIMSCAGGSTNRSLFVTFSGSTATNDWGQAALVYLGNNGIGIRNATAGAVPPSPKVLPTMSASNWYSFALVVKGGKAYGYVNGAELKYATQPSIDTAKTPSNFGVQRGIKYRNFIVYSRALTASEIAANYAIDKARFNLP